MKDLARKLRRNQTDSERRIWHHLKNRQMEGAKFRRQHIIGPYIVDFVCLERQLVVEIDGGHHTDQINDDSRRQRFLESQGFRVKRFWNHEVLSETDAVLEEIRRTLTPALSQRERE